LLVAVSIFFLIVEGIEFGDLKTQKWLTSLISGFFSSIFLIQPIKVKHFHLRDYLIFSIEDSIIGDILFLFFSKIK
jgi:hypothetical protein